MFEDVDKIKVVDKTGDVHEYINSDDLKNILGERINEYSEQTVKAGGEDKDTLMYYYTGSKLALIDLYKSLF